MSHCLFYKKYQFDPKQPTSYHNYGVCLLRKKDDEQARVYFQKAISLNPRLIQPYKHLGLIQSRAGNDAEAVKFMEKALKIDQKNIDPAITLELFWPNKGNMMSNISFLVCHKNGPQQHPAWLNLAYAYQDAGRYSEAMLRMKRSIK
jgi:Tfp pilus assembly protein PilF